VSALLYVLDFCPRRLLFPQVVDKVKAVAAAASPIVGSESSEADTASQPLGKNKKKKRNKGPKVDGTNSGGVRGAQAGPAPFSKVAQAAVDAIERGEVQGTLSDRLNPKHRHHDPCLNWKSFTKRERQAIVQADRRIIDNAAVSRRLVVLTSTMHFTRDRCVRCAPRKASASTW
jgi:hypothetical protein